MSPRLLSSGGIGLQRANPLSLPAARHRCSSRIVRFEERRPHGLEEMVNANVGFGEHCFDAGGFGLFQKLPRVLHGEHQHHWVRRDSGDTAGGFEAVHDGHGQIKQDQVGLEFPSQANRDLAVFGLAAHSPICLLLDAAANYAAERGAVVDDQDLFGHRPPRCRVLIDASVFPDDIRAAVECSVTPKPLKALPNRSRGCLGEWWPNPWCGTVANRERAYLSVRRGNHKSIG